MASADYWRQVNSIASAGRWQAATPLLDLTWSPAIPYHLAATVPETLVATMHDYPTANESAFESLRRSTASDWSHAWIVTSPDFQNVDPTTILGHVGRSFPADYELLGEVIAPDSGIEQRFWRPRAGVGSR